MEMLDISVIIVTYNHERYIRKAIESVLAQDFSGTMEVLIGDDYSQDSTREIIREYQSKYMNKIVPVYQEKNIGATRNAYSVFMKAKGKYLALLDGDDYWTDTNKLQKQFEYLEQNKDTMAVYHKVVAVNEYNKVIDKDFCMFDSAVYTLRDFERGRFPSQTGSCLCRNIFLSHDSKYEIFYQAHTLIGDCTLLLLLLEKGEIAILPERMSAYRIVESKDAGNAVSLKIRNNMYYEEWMYYSNLGDYAKENNIRVSMDFLMKCAYVSSVTRFLRTRRYKDYIVSKKILNQSGERIAYQIFLLRCSWGYLWTKLTRKNVHRLDIAWKYNHLSKWR
jgi:Glycosyltransferases involved in cell wall biogenesis